MDGRIWNFGWPRNNCTQRKQSTENERKQKAMCQEVKQALTCDLVGTFPMNNEYSLATTVLSFHTSDLYT